MAFDIGDLVALDLPNAPPMKVLGPVGQDVKCRWVDNIGQVHERDFHHGDLKPYEEKGPKGPVTKHEVREARGK